MRKTFNRFLKELLELVGLDLSSEELHAQAKLVYDMLSSDESEEKQR
jgi:hypothetical protein